MRTHYSNYQILYDSELSWKSLMDYTILLIITYTQKCDGITEDYTHPLNPFK